MNKEIRFERVKELCVTLGYTIEDFSYLLRLGNEYVTQLIDSDNPKETYKQILDKIEFDPVTLYRK